MARGERLTFYKGYDKGLLHILFTIYVVISIERRW